MKLKWKISFVLMGFTAAAVIFAGLVAVRSIDNGIETYSRSYLAKTTQQNVLTIENYMQYISENLAVLRNYGSVVEYFERGNVGTLSDTDKAQMQSYLRTRALSLADVEGVFFCSSAQTIISSSRPVTRIQTELQAMKPERFNGNQPIITDLFIDELQSSGKRYFAVILPVYNKLNEYIGCIVQQHNDSLLYKMVSFGRVFSTENVVVLDTKLNFIISGNISVATLDDLKRNHQTNFGDAVRAADFDAKPYGTIAYTWNGLSKTSYYQRVSSSGWIVFTSILDNEMLNDITALDIALLICIMLLFPLCIFTGFYTASRYASQQESFRDVIRRIADGDLTARAVEKDEENNSYVNSAFNHLADVIQQERTEKDRRLYELAQSNERYRIITDYTKEIIFEWNFETDEADYSYTWWKKFGYDPITVNVYESMTKAANIHPDDRHVYSEWLNAVYRGRENSKEEFRIRTFDDEYFWVRVRTVPIVNQQNESIKLIGLIQDIDDTKKREYELTLRADFDYLSQVYTRGAFETKIAECIKNSTRFALLYIDIDDFRVFNTRFGHEFGDRVIQFIGRSIQAAVDTAGFSGRSGGDEFVVCLTEKSAADDPGLYAGKIIEYLRAGLPMRESDKNHPVKCSIGIARFPDNGASFDELCSCADKAMYQVKHSGKNSYGIFTG